MRGKKLTGLAATAISYRDKVAGTTDQIDALAKQLEAGGDDYADACNQCEVINRKLDELSDAFVDLSVLILKADKVRAADKEEPASLMSDAANQEEQAASKKQEDERNSEVRKRKGIVGLDKDKNVY